MLKQVSTNSGVIEKVDKENNRFIQFIDSKEFDFVLQLILKWLFKGIIIFCLPFFCYMLFCFLI